MTRKGVFVYDDALSRHVLRPDHPLRPVRLRHTYELLEHYRAFQGDNTALEAPRPATEDEIRSFHSIEYVRAVKSLSRGERAPDPASYNFSSGGDNPIYEGMFEAALLSTGASIVAAERVAEGRSDVAFNISGGLHHAAAGQASGFCVFNDPVVAINHLLSKGMRVAYVDIDVHHGDGVQNAFYETDRVLTISVHESGRFLFPGTGSVEEAGLGPGRGYSVNLPLYPYTGDDTYLWAFREVVPPLIQAFRPDALVTQLGVDSYYNDPLAHLLLTSRGFGEAVKEFDRMGLPWVAMGGGGYDIAAVARCWTLAYGIMVGKEWPLEIPGELRDTHPAGLLRDTQMPLQVSEDRTAEAQTFAESSVEELKRTFFRLHNIV